MEEREIKQKIMDGYLYIRTIIEIVGKPESYVKDALETHLKKLKEDKEITITKETVEKPDESDNYFSAFAELEVLMKPKKLPTFCFDYMPSSIEILEPQKITMDAKDLSDFLNDLQGRSHNLNTGIIQMRGNLDFHVKNTAILLRNFAVVLLSARALSVDQLHPYMGVKKEDIKKVLDVLIKEGKVKKEGDKYRAIPNDRLQK